MIEPLTHYHSAGVDEDISHGEDLIQKGKVGCIVLAGGDGMRLGHDGPKGTFPISLIKKKSLFKLLDEKLEAAKKFYDQDLKVAIMTSPHNDASIKEHLKEAHYPFEFFSQNMLSMLDENKKNMGKESPNGNGQVLHCFAASEIYPKWKEAGVEYIQVILVDNPLAKPFDPNLCGIHAKEQAQVSIKAVEKTSPDEKVGVIGLKSGKVSIIEYSEAPPKEWNLANTSLFCFSMSFVEKVQKCELPLHIVEKSHEGRIFYKCEYFIFDLLNHSEKTEVILYPRDETFAPLKEKEDTLKVQKALLQKDREVFFEISGIDPKESVFELHPCFHYPTKKLKEKWQGRSLPEQTPYIES